jgi:hypothetical protein
MQAQILPNQQGLFQAASLLGMTFKSFGLYFVDSHASNVVLLHS